MLLLELILQFLFCNYYLEALRQVVFCCYANIALYPVLGSAFLMAAFLQPLKYYLMLNSVFSYFWILLIIEFSQSWSQ